MAISRRQTSIPFWTANLAHAAPYLTCLKQVDQSDEAGLTFASVVKVTVVQLFDQRWQRARRIARPQCRFRLILSNILVRDG